MTRLDYDIDNFSGKNSRGDRYDIYADGELAYSDVSESEVDSLVADMEAKPWLYGKIAVRIITKK